MAAESEKKDNKPEAAAQAPAEGSKSKSKVTRMTLHEVDAALENAQKHMGGHYSAYAQSLLAKRAALLNHPNPVSAKPKRKSA